MTDYTSLALEAHLLHKGKLEIHSKVPLETKDDLATFYSPGVAAPCLKIAEDEESAYNLTRKHNTIAIVSDGSAVLGLGNIGGLAGLPVMEGKAILFKAFGGVDAIPLVLSTQDPDEIIKTVEAIAPTFWGINLEDIAAPHCFYIETELKKRLNIPVFHDDQHGTAIVVLAGLINALKLKGVALSDQKIVISGAGAAAIAIGKLLHQAGATNIIFADSKGLISSSRSDLNAFKQELLPLNVHNVAWTLQDALLHADIFIGVSKGNLLKAEDIQHMATDPVIFALANPTPEIMPDVAKAAGAFIVATGRSDFPNQVNNVLAFPGIFRGALDARLPQITEEHKIAAAQALAAYIAEPDVDHILPSALDKGVANVIANAISHLPSIQSQISLFPYNTLRIDVQAKYFVEIRTEEELQALFASKIFHQEKRIILWGGANTFFTGNVEGLVIKVSLQGKEVIKKEKNQIFVRVAAGEDWSSFVEYANAQGRAGIENLIAIPGNVGTAPFSNIGAYGMEVSKVIAQVEGYDLSTGEKKLFSHAECQFSYRNSIFKSHLKNQFLITHVVFVLQQFDENYQFVTDYSDIQALLSTSASLAEQDDGHLTLPQMSKMIAEIRAKKLPDVKKVGTVGSFFVNPLLCMQHFEALKKEYPTIPSYPVDQEVVKVPAAWLIEQCGLKGYINGKAGTSPDHALIVVNYWGDANDVLAVVQHIQHAVKEQFGVELLPEAMYV